jgi:caffeoyl-CoA O-methyltransferase
MTTYNDELSQYITGLFAREDSGLQALHAAADAAGLPDMRIQPEEGRFLQFITRLVAARKAVEIGTLGGYSGTWIARGLLPGGKLITLEVSEKHAATARENFARTGVADRVEVRVGDAHESLKKLAAEGPFDLCFIDAEKTGYDRYLDWALAHVRAGGLIAAHNAFHGGDVLKHERDGSDVVHAVNARFASEPRLLATIYPGGDGLVMGIVLG